MQKNVRFLLRWPLESLYREANLPAAISRSLNWMLLGNLFGNLFGVICGGGTTAMIGLANELHAGDFAFGVLNGIPQAAALLQIPFSMLVSRTHQRKKYLLTFGLFSRFLWLLFGLIPLIVPQNPAWLPLWTLIFLLGVSSCCSGAINVCWFPWFSDLAPLRIRGRWFSFRDTVIAACNLAFGILTARLLDTLPPDRRYVIIFLLGGTLGMLDMICFGFCEEKYVSPPRKMHVRSMLREVAGNRPFMRLVVMWTAWCFTANLCEPYLYRYSINEMALTFTQMMVFGSAAAAVGTILSMRMWGKALDSYGCKSVMMTAGVAASLTNLFYLFSAPGAVWPVLLRNFGGALFWSGTNLAANSMQLSCSPDETRPSYIAVFSCVTALLGVALGTVLGGALLEGLERLRWFSGGFDRYKALILLSCAVRFAAVLLLVPPMQNDREGTARQMIGGLTHGMKRAK